MSRILVAEDEQRISAFIEKGLRASGFAVTVVNDGLEGLVQLESMQQQQRATQEAVVAQGVHD